MQEILLGTIGSGFIVRSILDCVMKTPGIRPVAVYSRTQQRGEGLAAEYSIGKVYTDMDAFLADPQINFVYIATPNSLHYDQARKALLAGKNVILEKPFTPLASQTEELIRIARERGLYLYDAVPTAYLPNLELLREALPQIGRIRLVMSNYSQYSSRYDQLLAGQVPNIFHPAFAEGALMDLNFYNLWLNVALFGEPVEAMYTPNIYPGLADTSGSLTLRYPDFVSQNAGAKDTWGVNFFQIEGEQGYIYVEGGGNVLDAIRVVTRQGETVLNRQPEPDRWGYEVRQITRQVLAGELARCHASLDTTLQVIRTLERARRSGGMHFPCDEPV